MRGELALCDRWGIPHSHFLGGPLEWSDLDRAKALAYREFTAHACPGCGTHPWEWDPDEGGSRDAYVGDWDYCQGCSRLHEVNESVDDDDRARGIRVFLSPPDKVVSDQ